jgi:hypothetical protein
VTLELLLVTLSFTVCSAQILALVLLSFGFAAASAVVGSNVINIDKTNNVHNILFKFFISNPPFSNY